MRLAGLAMLVALGVGGASAQPVLDPSTIKPKVTQTAEDAVKTSVNQVSSDLNRNIRGLQDDVASAAEKAARDDRDFSARQKAAALPAKNAKLAQDNAAIGGQMAEAKDKAAKAMNGANNQLTTGIISGAVQAGAGTQATGEQQGDGKTKPKPAATACKNCPPGVKPH